MADQTYLIAIALIKQGDRRTMPMGGKSLKETIETDSAMGSEAERVALELLLRVISKSKLEPITTLEQDKSVLIAQIPFLNLNNKFPELKAEWIQSGNTDQFLNQLIELSSCVWNLEFVKYKGLSFHLIS